MLKSLSINNVGPFRHLEFRLDPRLNVITGDNGLGKSLLLDLAFWAECGLWPRARATPSEPPPVKATIDWVLLGDDGKDAMRSAHYRPQVERWTRRTVEGEKRRRRPVVLYAMVDGGFAVFDQARAGEVMHEEDEDFKARRASLGNGYYILQSEDVFDGLKGEDGYVCNGLIRDWADWQYRRKVRFKALSKALKTLSADIGESIKPGRPRRVSSRDSRDIPWLEMPYGGIPITQASAAVRRILGLAYMLVWAWNEHIDACRLTDTPPTSELLLLFDEVECHLHPKWQRVVLPALIQTIGQLTNMKKPQIVAATHSPLVLASLEPLFSESEDQLLLLELGKKKRVTMRREPFVRRSRADIWLTSDMFGLKTPTSAPAEKAIGKARKLLQDRKKVSASTVKKVSSELRGVLSDTDPLLARMDALGNDSRKKGAKRAKPAVAKAVL